MFLLNYHYRFSGLLEHKFQSQPFFATFPSGTGSSVVSNSLPFGTVASTGGLLSQFLRFATALFRQGALQGHWGVQSVEIAARFRFDVSIVHLHVDDFHVLDLGGQFLDFLLNWEELKQSSK